MRLKVTMSSFTTIATDLIELLGLTGVAIGLGVNSMGIPIPSEIILPLAGLGARQGQYSFLIVIIVGTLAQVVGLILAYIIGRLGGLELVETYGKYAFISHKAIKRATNSFERYGGRLVFFGLLLPGVHGYVGYPAGIAKMSLWRFIIAATAGSAIWAIVLATLGYYLGGYISEIDAFFQRFAFVVVVVLLGAGVIWYTRRHKRKNK